MAVHALAQLIQDVQDQSDPRLSLNQIAKRAGLSSSRVHQMASQPMKAMPDPDTLQRLADALRVPLRLVVDAALTSLGLPSTQPSYAQGTVAEMRRIVETSTILRPEDRDTWTALIDGLERRTSDQDRDRPRRRKRGAPEYDSTEAAEQAMNRPRPVLSDDVRLQGLRQTREIVMSDKRAPQAQRAAMVAQLDQLIAAIEAGEGDESDAL